MTLSGTFKGTVNINIGGTGGAGALLGAFDDAADGPADESDGQDEPADAADGDAA